MQDVPRQRLAEGVVRETQRRRRVGAAAAEAGRDREPLLDRRVPAGLDAGPRCEGLERAADERVAGEAVDAQLGGRRDVDPVGHADALVDGDELVLAVVAQRPDDERQVDLRGSGSPHRSASASARNSGGASASARTDGSRPIAASASTARSRLARPAISSEFGSVLRR